MKKTIGMLLGVGSLGLASTSFATVITIPDSALSNSPGVYTAGGYYTDDLGDIVVTTGGGNAANVGALDGRNDDGFRGPVSLGFDVSFFGNTYNSLYINTNGNVSFGGGISAYTPSGPQGASQPIISPFFGDVDTRGAQSGVVHVNQSIADQIIVTWDHVGYYGAHDDLLNSFQLVLRGSNYSVPTGEGAIGFFYEDMQWETGDASNGTGGFGGTPAAVGFGDGASNGEVLDGSIQDGIAGIVNQKYIWFDPNLQPVNPGGGGNHANVPEPGALALLGLGLIGLSLDSIRRRKKSA